MGRPKANPDAKLLRLMEDGVEAILSSETATPTEKLAAINAGVKVIAIRHRINADDDQGFFR